MNFSGSVRVSSQVPYIGFRHGVARGLGNNVLPFWVVFQGDIARDPKRVREIHCWYKGHEDHFFLWHDSKDGQSILEHFKRRLRHLLE